MENHYHLSCKLSSTQLCRLLKKMLMEAGRDRNITLMSIYGNIVNFRSRRLLGFCHATIWFEFARESNDFCKYGDIVLDTSIDLPQGFWLFVGKTGPRKNWKCNHVCD